MNKSFLCVVVAVCVLGMALIMLQEKLHDPQMGNAPAEVSGQSPDAPAPPAQNEPEAPLQPAPPAKVAEPAPQSPALPAAPRPGTQPRKDETAAAPAKPSVAPLPEPVASPDTTPPRQETQKSADAATAAKPAAAAKPAPAARPETPAKPAPAARPETPAKPDADTRTAGGERSGAGRVPARPAAEEQARKITKFVVFARDKGATVRLVGTSPIVYKSMELSDPSRMALDLDGIWEIKAPGVPKNTMVTNVRLGKNGQKTRIVIDLTQKPRVRFVPAADRKSLDIRLDENATR